MNDTRLGGLPALIVGRASTEDFLPLIADGFLALGTKDSIVVAASSFASTVRNGVAMTDDDHEIDSVSANERTNDERDRAVAFAGKVVTFDASRTDETFGVRGVARRRVTRRRVDFAVEGNERKKTFKQKGAMCII